MRVLIAGAGRAGANHAAHLHPGEIAGVFDADADAARTLAERCGTIAYTSLADALDGCDAVVVATPTFTHRELVVAAAGAGRHVLCEKPMALPSARR
jgi:predicted dehydrogenase